MIDNQSHKTAMKLVNISQVAKPLKKNATKRICNKLLRYMLDNKNVFKEKIDEQELRLDVLEIRKKYKQKSWSTQRNTRCLQKIPLKISV